LQFPTRKIDLEQLMGLDSGRDRKAQSRIARATLSPRFDFGGWIAVRIIGSTAHPRVYTPTLLDLARLARTTLCGRTICLPAPRRRVITLNHVPPQRGGGAEKERGRERERERERERGRERASLMHGPLRKTQSGVHYFDQSSLLSASRRRARHHRPRNIERLPLPPIPSSLPTPSSYNFLLGSETPRMPERVFSSFARER